MMVASRNRGVHELRARTHSEPCVTLRSQDKKQHGRCSGCEYGSPLAPIDARWRRIDLWVGMPFADIVQMFCRRRPPRKRNFLMCL